MWGLSSKVLAALRLAGHWSACGMWRATAFASLIFFLFASLTKLSLSQLLSSHALALPIFSLSSLGQGVSEQLCRCLAVSWDQPTTESKLQ